MRWCWSCKFQRMFGELAKNGFCAYFATKQQAMKEIPDEIVGVGCKFWEGKNEGGDTAKETGAQGAPAQTNS